MRTSLVLSHLKTKHLEHKEKLYILFLLMIFLFKFIYFLAVLVVCCCAGVSWLGRFGGRWEVVFIEVPCLLIAVASLVAENGL